MRRIAAVSLLVAGLLVAPVIAGASDLAQQPAPPGPGVPAPIIEAGYRASQSDPGLSDEDRVKAAINTYFTLKYESRVRAQAIGLGIVIDRNDPAGQSLHDYEVGRLFYSVAVWRETRKTFRGYRYRPEFLSLQIRGDRATVEVRPWVDLTYLNPAAPSDVDGAERHRITLVRSALGWRLIRDDYEDDFTQAYPRGTDFAVLLQTLAQRMAAAEARDREVEARLRSDPRAAPRFAVNRDCSSGGHNTLFVNDAGSCKDCQNFLSRRQDRSPRC